MTRRSKREIERALDGLGAEGSDPPASGVVHEHPVTGEWYETAALEEPAPSDANPLAVICDSVVASRERAERKGYDIIRPVDDDEAPAADLVEIHPDSLRENR